MTDQTALQTPGEPTPMAIIAQMVASGADKDTLKELFALQRQWTQDKAAEAFADALTGFKSRCPQIEKRAKATIPGKDGKQGWGYMYAPLDDVDSIIRPLMTEFKIVDTYSTKLAGEGVLEVTCRLRVGIHVEESSMPIPIPKGVVNNTQLMGQARSYGQRYTLCAALGLVTKNEDQDAGGLADFISPEQVGELNDLFEKIEQAGGQIDNAGFLRFALQKDKLADDDHMGLILCKNFQDVVSMLNDKLANQRKKGKKS